MERVRQCMLEDTEREGFGKRFHFVGNVREYGEGYEEGGVWRARGQNPDTNMVRIV